MKKVLFVCDGDNFPQGAFRFVKALRQEEPIFVKGVFYTPIDIEQLISVSYIPIAEPYVKLKEDERRLVSQSVEKFKSHCDGSNIRYHIHNRDEAWDKALLSKESRFADLIVISEDLFCSNADTDQPNFFMQEALHGAECPIVVVPETFKSVDRLAIAYDGKKECMFALKQFGYLLPQFTDLPAEFVYAKNDETDAVPDRELLTEYACWHFNNLATSKLHFEGKKYFSAWLEDKKNVMLVAGSYSRSAVSNLLNRSFVDHVIHDHACPVFIAHA